MTSVAVTSFNIGEKVMRNKKAFMLAIALPEHLHRRMKEYKKILPVNWSEVARQAFIEKLGGEKTISARLESIEKRLGLRQ